jgi:ribonuclease Z
MEKILITPLGITGAVPQKNKNFASNAISFYGKNLLFDVPEGTQKQLMNSNLSLMKIDYVFLSHMHADHFLGLFGWIATMTLNERTEKLTIFSPRGGKQKIQRMLKEVVRPSFEIDYKEIKKGVILKEKEFVVEGFPLKHEISCYGFVFKENDLKGRFDRKKAEKLGIPSGPLYSKLVEGKTIHIGGKKFSKKDVFDYSKGRKGRKIGIVMDTRPSKETIKAVKNAELLIHEGTFLDEHKDKAIESCHSTVKEASLLAKKARVKKLLLTHFSARITDLKIVQKEAEKEFKNSKVAKEFESIEL